MKNILAKISLFIIIGTIILSCDATKRVPNDKKLLTKNDIYVDSKKDKSEDVFNQLYQKQNSSIFGYPLRLHIYNIAKPKTDSLFKDKMIKNPKRYYRKSKILSKKQVKRLGQSFIYTGIHNFLRKTGEAPVIHDTISTQKSLKRLNSYFFNRGYFDVKSKYSVDSFAKKRVKLKYEINRGSAYFLDSIDTAIKSKPLDSIYQLRKNLSFIKSKKKYETKDFEDERTRITADFRNNGAFYFNQNYVTYTIDTSKQNHKTNVKLVIEDQNIRLDDTTTTIPFKLYKINKVKIFTDFNPLHPNLPIADSVTYNNFTLYSTKKLRYKPKAITDGVFVNIGNYFSEDKSTLTAKYLSNLRVFNYPNIQYKEDANVENGLITSIYLSPRKKYNFNAALDFTHSNIQDFGITGNTGLTIRNVFNGAETLEIAFRGNIGASKDFASQSSSFFNISEIGIDSKLNFPRLLLPFITDKLIPKTMLPYTTFSLGFAAQKNIGLDKQNFTSSLTYNWTPKKNTSIRFDLFNIQFVKNLNISNYFRVYESSYDSLNELAGIYNTNQSYVDVNNDNNLLIDFGTNGFINDVLGQNPVVNPTIDDYNTIRSIEERRIRLTQNNLIFASSFSYSKTSKKDLFDDNFYAFKGKIESAGNVLSLFARLSKQLKNQNGANTIFEVEYSQYIKTEFEFIKHWDLSRKKVLATRSFFGIAVPYGNSNNIPFSRSYFGGGSNDNRAWQSYGLGPGKTGSKDDFNEANMKIAFSTEFRFNIFKQINGALFSDIGNIWNIADDVTDSDAIFSSLKSLENIAIGTGAGLRYDFSFFVVRLDLGFKTYNPAQEKGRQWLKEMRFDKSVLNIGINYPF